MQKSKRNSTKWMVAFLTATLFLSGCTYVRSVSQTNFPQNRTKKVSANAYKFIFLGFNFNNDHALTLDKKLRKACPGGDVRGVLTKDTNVMYFLMFFWAHDITATGYCVPKQTAGLEDIIDNRDVVVNNVY